MKRPSRGRPTCPYQIPNLAVTWQIAPAGVPVIWLRSVGHTHTAFVVESFIDELAHAAAKDPFEYRRALLAKHPRHKRVLELAAEKAGWGSPLPEGRGRGIAVHESFGSFVADVAEVSVSPEGNCPRPSGRLCDRLRPGRQPGLDPGPDGRLHRVWPDRRVSTARSRSRTVA